MRRLAWLSIAIALSGCGMNAVIVGAAGEQGRAATAIAVQSRAALAAVDQRRRDAYVALIASDPSCTPVNPIYIFVPRNAPTGPPSAKDAPPLCAKGANDMLPGYVAERLEFSAVSAETIQPTIDLIAALATYGAAMTDIVEAPKPNVADDLAAALDIAVGAKALAESLGASGLPNLGQDQVATATKLVALLSELAQERRQVRDIRRLFAEQAPAIDTILGELDAQLTLWQRDIGGSYAGTLKQSLLGAYGRERERTTFDQRRALAALVVEAREEPQRIAAATKRFSAAIDEFRAGQQSLANLLAGHPTPEQRAAAARISRQRFATALTLLAETITAWKAI